MRRASAQLGVCVGRVAPSKHTRRAASERERRRDGPREVSRRWARGLALHFSLEGPNRGDARRGAACCACARGRVSMAEQQTRDSGFTYAETYQLYNEQVPSSRKSFPCAAVYPCAPNLKATKSPTLTYRARALFGSCTMRAPPIPASSLTAGSKIGTTTFRSMGWRSQLMPTR